MGKKESIVSGRIVSPSIIEVKTDRTQLISGQKVLIYRPTDRRIMSPSGKKIGMRERVLGSGKVAVEGDKVVIKVSKNANAITPLRAKSTAQRHTKLVQKTRLNRKKSIRPFPSLEVYVKPIEE